MRNSKEIQDYWNDVHSQNHIGALSGCQYLETINFLKLKDHIKQNINVLEIGVGLGYVTKGLKTFGISVSALDISQKALKRVENICEKTYITDNVDFLPSNYFDIILCHNVIQHIPTFLLNIELYHIIRSLKTTGIFALEFISSTIDEDTGSEEFLEFHPTFDQNIGCYCRSPKYLEKMINKHSGVCELVYDCNTNISEVITGCHVFHVTK